MDLDSASERSTRRKGRAIRHPRTSSRVRSDCNTRIDRGEPSYDVAMNPEDRSGRGIALDGWKSLRNDEELCMSTLFACQGSPYAPGHTQLQLVVQFYAIVYLAFLLGGLACLGIRSFFVALSKGGDDFPPDDHRRDSGGIGPRPPLARSPAGRWPRTRSTLSTITTDRHRRPGRRSERRLGPYRAGRSSTATSRIGWGR